MRIFKAKNENPRIEIPHDFFFITPALKFYFFFNLIVEIPLAISIFDSPVQCKFYIDSTTTHDPPLFFRNNPCHFCMKFEILLCCSSVSILVTSLLPDNQVEHIQTAWTYHTNISSEDKLGLTYSLF